MPTTVHVEEGQRFVTCRKCHKRVWLDDAWANPCPCGLEYNLAGQELAPRSQWGYETGERF